MCREITSRFNQGLLREGPCLQGHARDPRVTEREEGETDRQPSHSTIDQSRTEQPRPLLLWRLAGRGAKTRGHLGRDRNHACLGHVFSPTLQRSPLFCAPGLVKFVPAVTRLFCLALPGSFLTMFAQNKGALCTLPR